MISHYDICEYSFANERYTSFSIYYTKQPQELTDIYVGEPWRDCTSAQRQVDYRIDRRVGRHNSLAIARW